MSNPRGEERAGDRGTCSEIQEVDVLGAVGQNNVELVAGPDLADQGLRQEGLQSRQQPLGHRLLGTGPGTPVRGRRLNLAHHLQGICWWWPTGWGREAERRKSVRCQGQDDGGLPCRPSFSAFSLISPAGLCSVSSSAKRLPLSF